MAKWVLVDDDWNTWECECGLMWALTAGDPKKNEMNYCPKCGEPIEEGE